MIQTIMITSMSMMIITLANTKVVSQKKTGVLLEALNIISQLHHPIKTTAMKEKRKLLLI